MAMQGDTTSHPVPRCLVIGASGCIGAAVCKTMADRDTPLVLAVREVDARAQELQSICGAVGIVVCDVRDEQSVQSAVTRAAEMLGGLDALVLATGLTGDPETYPDDIPGDTTSLEQTDREAFEELMAVHAWGAVTACKAAHPVLRAGGGGNIVLLGALSGTKFVPAPVAVAASKAAVKGVSESVAKSLGPDNIRVNVVAPGLVDGGMGGRLRAAVRDSYAKHTALKRLAAPEEVAEVVAWFALDNTYISGQTVLVDGGL
jgi:3-oxoacyl-[acyl-carrier protein] reductase